MERQEAFTIEGVEYIYGKPPEHLLRQKMLLLTNGRVAAIGYWRGEYGEYFIGYQGLVERNKDKERELIARGVIR